MGRFDGKVALITGAARGQGRAEAERLAREGADVILLDAARAIEHNVARAATPEDLERTADLVRGHGQRAVVRQVDVRDFTGLKAAVDAGVAELGRLDIVIANAGMLAYGRAEEITEDEWTTVTDVMLKGVWLTAKAVIPVMKAQGSGGVIIITSSVAGLRGAPTISHYAAAKHGLTGLMRSLAMELGSDHIRVNTVNPTTVDTDLIHNSVTYARFGPDMSPEDRTRESLTPRFVKNDWGLPWVSVDDVAAAVLFLASDEARYINGITLPIDAGSLLR